MIKIGVIGVGYLGRFHTLIYSKMPNVALIGIVDANIERSQAVAQEAGCPYFSKLEDLLEKIDAVSIVVPTSVHLQVAKPFLERGIHVLLEKPIAATREEGEEIVALAASSGATLQIGHLERFNPGVTALAQRIQQPRFIEAQRMGKFAGRAHDVDVVVDLMIHDIDIILSLIATPLVSVAAVGASVLTQHIDIANARLVFANGAVANVVASRVAESKSRRIRVFQPQTYMALDMEKPALELAIPKPHPNRAWPDIVREQIKLEHVKPLDAELAAFVDAIRFKQRPIVDGRVGLQALDVALRVREEIAVTTNS